MSRKRKERSPSVWPQTLWHPLSPPPLSSSSSSSSLVSSPSSSITKRDSFSQWLDNESFGTSTAAATADIRRFESLSCCGNPDPCHFNTDSGSLQRLPLCCERVPHLELFIKLGRLKSLEEIEICDCPSDFNRKQTLVKHICCNLPFLKKLVIRCKLRDWPKSLLQLENLDTLFLDGYNLARIPAPAVLVRGEGLEGSARDLRKLTLKSCLPETIGNLLLWFPNIQELSLNACINEIPKEIGTLKGLKSLEIHHCNRLSRLPLEIQNLTQLGVLSIESCSQLVDMPFPIHKLSSLTTLRFNPYSYQFDVQKFVDLNACDSNNILKIPSISLRTLQLYDDKVLLNCRPQYCEQQGKHIVRILEQHRQLCNIGSVDICKAFPKDAKRIQTWLGLNASGIRLLEAVDEAEQRQSLWPYLLEHFLNRNKHLSDQVKHDYVFSVLRNGLVFS